MKISVLIALILMVVFSSILVRPAFAKSDVNISDSSNFSSEVKDFSSGQTIFVRVKYDSDYSQVNLTLDDNNSNPLKTVSMGSIGNHTYSGSLTAPTSANYYLIRIEASNGEGSKSTIVRTIKVGDISSASLNVNIDSKTGGEKVTSGNTTVNTTTNTSTNTSSDNKEEGTTDNVSIITQEITSKDDTTTDKKDENRLIKTILFITNPMLFVTFLLLS